jgi:hypothetical protein
VPLPTDEPEACAVSKTPLPADESSVGFADGPAGGFADGRDVRAGGAGTDADADGGTDPAVAHRDGAEAPLSADPPCAATSTAPTSPAAVSVPSAYVVRRRRRRTSPRERRAPEGRSLTAVFRLFSRCMTMHTAVRV